MAKKITKHSHHSLKRCYQRFGLTNENQAQAFINNARKYGKNAWSYEENDPIFFEKYLLPKLMACNKTIKIYKGYVFVLNSTRKTGTGATTVYKLPKEWHYILDCEGENNGKA